METWIINRGPLTPAREGALHLLGLLAKLKNSDATEDGD